MKRSILQILIFFSVAYGFWVSIGVFENIESTLLIKYAVNKTIVTTIIYSAGVIALNYFYFNNKSNSVNRKS